MGKAHRCATKYPRYLLSSARAGPHTYTKHRHGIARENTGTHRYLPSHAQARTPSPARAHIHAEPTETDATTACMYTRSHA
eukprot:3124029-Pleurochrysis_carterae.AAC.1